MKVIVDGSYTNDLSDIIRCGVIMVDELGFYEDRQFKRKHVEASSSFAEWFGVECALNLLLERFKYKPVNGKVIIYTDYLEVINIMTYIQKEATTIKVHNEFLNSYIKFIRALYRSLVVKYEAIYKEPISIEFRHLNEYLDVRYIVRLHKKAHNMAQDRTPKYNKSINTLEENSRYPKVELRIMLEVIQKGVRKWVIYENGKRMYQGKLRDIIRKYNRNRYNIVILIEQNQLKIDKKTKSILEKYL